MKSKPLYITGISASPGIVIGKACVIEKNEAVITGVLLKDEEDIPVEIEKYDEAVKMSIDEIEIIKTSLDPAFHQEALEILETQIELLRDPQIKADVVEKIKEDRKNANDALIEVIAGVVHLFKNMNDEYMSARSADVQDAGNRILKHLHTSLQADSRKFAEDTIIISEDIAPSDTITMDISHVIGFATRAGGKTSHAAIIAKSRNIPAVVGCDDGWKDIQNDDVIILDGVLGVLIINPGQEAIDEYKIKREAYLQKSIRLKSLAGVSAATTDGVEIKLLANISGAEDMGPALEYGAEGVGLFRTELLFMGRNSFPSEEEQYEFYKKAAIQSRGKPVIVRTLDIGGDKQLSYFGLPDEQNPFLGYRAIRICLDRKDIFITQLKAILRAAVFGDFKIMFPMISNVQELRLAKEILTQAKNELLQKAIEFDKNIEVGIMIEIPSAALTADILAKEVDFFSIGTNDLCQYTLAVDRMNEKIKDLYDPFNPGVLRLIKYVIEQGHKNKIRVGMCGELASDPVATLLLLGMGLNEFSMSAGSIPLVKNVIINNSMETATQVCKKVMEMDNSKNIARYLQEVKK